MTAPAVLAPDHVEYPVIGGERARDGAAEFFDSVNPATGHTVARVVQSSGEAVEAAVAAAAAAQRVWAGWAPDARAQALWRWGELILAAAQELADLDTLDIGRPARDTATDPATCARAARYWAGQADRVVGSQLPVIPGHLSYTVREPLGVVAVILPWNGPCVSFLNRVAPALACGNAVVVKPSEWSSLSAGRLAELAVAAGMPRGVLNVLPGDGRVGAALCGDPRVAGISFTGSVPTGRAIARAAAGRVVTLEMGGKSPNLVFADADLTLGAAAATWGVFANTGQVCCASTRLLVQDTIADEFVAAILTRVAALRVGDPFDPATQLGPLACRPQYERVRRVVSAAVDDGAQVLVGGTRPAGVGDGGFYLAPTVVAEAKPDSALIREEVFGPVLAVERFCDEEEALALANEGSYGLAANIWTGDGGRMLRLAAGLEVGTVWGNSSRVMDPALPFGGFKDSGVGNAYGEGAVEGSTRLKRVSIRFDEAAPVPSWPGSPS